MLLLVPDLEYPAAMLFYWDCSSIVQATASLLALGVLILSQSFQLPWNLLVQIIFFAVFVENIFFSSIWDCVSFLHPLPSMSKINDLELNNDRKDSAWKGGRVFSIGSWLGKSRFVAWFSIDLLFEFHRCLYILRRIFLTSSYLIVSAPHLSFFQFMTPHPTILSAQNLLLSTRLPSALDDLVMYWFHAFWFFFKQNFAAPPGHTRIERRKCRPPIKTRPQVATPPM